MTNKSIASYISPSQHLPSLSDQKQNSLNQELLRKLEFY